MMKQTIDFGASSHRQSHFQIPSKLKQIQLVKTFLPVDQLEYIFQSHRQRLHIPCCYDFIDTQSPVFSDYYIIMYERMKKYPSIQYIFITTETKQDIMTFFVRFPHFAKIVNVVKYDSRMKEHVQPDQLPFCFLTDENNRIVYEGAVHPENYLTLITVLNSKARRVPTVEEFIPSVSDKLKSRQLSLALSGLTPRLKDIAPRYRSKSVGCKTVNLLQSSAGLDRNLHQIGARNNLWAQAHAKAEYMEDQNINRIIQRISSMEL